MKTMEAIAVEVTPFGSYVEIGPVKGLVKRPPDAGDRTAHQPGENMTIITEGGCKGAEWWIEMRGGRPYERRYGEWVEVAR